MHQEPGLKSFDDLRDADLQRVYEGNKRQSLRESAFRARLESCDSLEKLTQLAFGDAAGLERWTTREILEISNAFRLFDAPEYEIRLYEAARNAGIDSIPRAREFYLLALNRAGRVTDAIAECRQMLSEGGGNGVLWGILGNSYSLRMQSAETYARELEAVAGEAGRVENTAKTAFLGANPGLDLGSVTPNQVHSLRRQFLSQAVHAYRRGFEQSGDTFPGFFWMIRTLDQYVDLLEERSCLLDRRHCGAPDTQAETSLQLVEARLGTLELQRATQPALLGIALEMGGDREALDFWPHAGRLLLACIQGHDMTAIEPILARTFATIDTDFKLRFLLDDLTRIRDQYAGIVNSLRKQKGKTDKPEQALERILGVLAEFTAGGDRFNAGGKRRGSALNEYYRTLAEEEPPGAEELFLKRTFNFRDMVNNPVPQYVQGGIGRVGARVPDLMINRNVQEDLQAIIREKVLPALAPEERMKPLDVAAVIQCFVGAWLGLAELQDLQSPAHLSTDTRSDGLILLSGIDQDMRIGARSTTDLTAALLLRTGDCRETTYLNGALFACYQQMRALEKLKEALQCMDRGSLRKMQRIIAREIPAILSHQLRGGHVAVFVEGISMRQKYQVERMCEDDPLAAERSYGLEEFSTGTPLSRYELENAKLRVSYSDGSVEMLEPRDLTSGNWQPIVHIPVPGGGGVPRISTETITGGVVTDIKLLNLVEEHTMSFMYNGAAGQIGLCDGFYNHCLFVSPYRFGSGSIEAADLLAYRGLIRAGTRPLRVADGTVRNSPVFIEFLPHSTTDYSPSLGEGDFPGVFQLMGRLFKGNLRAERQRLEEGTSAIPLVLERVHAWHVRQLRATQQAQVLDKHVARVLIELARDRPELVSMRDISRGHPLMRQGQESDSVYLVVSGQFQTYRDGNLLQRDGQPELVPVGTLVGELSALRGCLPAATVMGEGVVLHLAKSEFLRQLEFNPAFRESVEGLIGTPLELEHLCGK